MQVRAGLNLNRNDVRTGLGEVGHVLFRLHNHQVDVQRLGRHRPQGLDDQGSNRDVRNEAAVHHVHVDPVGTGLINSADVLAQA